MRNQLLKCHSNFFFFGGGGGGGHITIHLYVNGHSPCSRMHMQGTGDSLSDLVLKTRLENWKCRSILNMTVMEHLPCQCKL